MSIIFLSLTIFFLEGCEKVGAADLSDPPKRYQLSIIMDSGYNQWAMHFELLSDSGNHTRRQVERVPPYHMSPSLLKASLAEQLNDYTRYLTHTEGFEYCWSGLKPGTYHLNMTNIFGDTLRLGFSLQGDTAFYLRNPFGIRLIDRFDRTGMFNTDTIEIIYVMSGCFAHHSERMLLIKNVMGQDWNFKLELQVPRDRIERSGIRTRLLTDTIRLNHYVRKEVFDDLFGLHLLSANLMDNPGSGVSTTSQHLFILINRQLFYFSDSGIDEWNLYHEFRRKYAGDLY